MSPHLVAPAHSLVGITRQRQLAVLLGSFTGHDHAQERFASHVMASGPLRVIFPARSGAYQEDGLGADTEKRHDDHTHPPWAAFTAAIWALPRFFAALAPPTFPAA